MTQVFRNETDLGNELAIRRGKVVPEDAVNLAYVKSPELSPAENVVIVDTSRVVAENAINLQERRKLYYANSLGILEDESGNKVVDDEYPYVTDVFSVDEDFITTPASEYRPEHILPFVHVSRYFHLDYAGLTMPNDLFDAREDILKVTDAKGRLYLDSHGKPRYKVKVTPAISMPHVNQGDQQAYRVYVYVDTDENLELFLNYNKVEVGNNGIFKKQRINYKERLNLRPVFEYAPEESEVVDRASWNKQIYSTKPVTLKEQILGLPYQNVDGFQVYVPKKAVGDPRIFQLFHWRVTCDFITAVATDQISFTGTIKAGVVVTNSNTQSRAAYAFLNLGNSAFNATKIKFINPLNQGTTGGTQETASYWHVNIDTVSADELKQFDILLWAPSTPSFDFGPYLQKIDAFTRAGGGTLFIDTTAFTIPQNLGLSVSNAVTHSSSVVTNTGHVAGSTYVNTITVDNANPLFDGRAQLGGWNLLDGQNNDEIRSLSYIGSMWPTLYYNDYANTQYISSVPNDWSVLVRAGGQPVTVAKQTGLGRIIFSTFAHLKSASGLFFTTPPTWVSPNEGATLYQYSQYQTAINSPTIEGAMKFLFNVTLLAVQGRSLSDNDQTAYSSSWAYSTDWQASWTINAAGDTLSQSEKDRYSFSWLPEDPTAATPILDPVWKRKLDNKTCEHLINEAVLANPMLRRRELGSNRRYRVEVSNSNILTDSFAQGNQPPYAWTKAYSPPFVVPRELGPNVVREEEIKASYAPGQFQQVIYPPKPYAGQVQASYAETTEQLTTTRTYWKAKGKALRTIRRRIPGETTYTPSTRDVRINWWDRPQTGGRNYNTVGEGLRPRLGYNHPIGIASWQEHNYYGGATGNAHLNWPYAGFTQRYMQGSSGEVVQFIQEALNKFQDFGFFTTSAGRLAVNGSYSTKVYDAVLDLQTRLGARFLDGVIDAETWSIIGYQIMRGRQINEWAFSSQGRGDFYRFFDYPVRFLRMDNISDGNNNTVYAKRSWVSGGKTVSAPNMIWDYIQITFNQSYKIKAVGIVPYLEGQTQTLLLRSIHVSTPFPMTGYLGGNAKLTLADRPANGQEWIVPLGPYDGDTITVGIAQDGAAGAGWGVARMMGLRDIFAIAEESYLAATTGEDTYENFTDEIDVEAEGWIDVPSFTGATHTIAYNYTGEGTIAPPVWNAAVTVSTHGIFAKAEPNGFLRFQNYEVVRSGSENNFTFGPRFPGGTYYGMNDALVMTPARETGFVSREEGIKLLVNADKTPYGFPAMPAGMGPNEYQRHFTTLTLNNHGNDASVKLSFYDIRRKEFIVNSAGKPELSYIEWVNRGPQNVFVSVLSEYEDKITQQIPEDNDTPSLPYRWAMPVYGLFKRGGARITLEPLPPKLGLTDVWPIAVRDGRFSRVVTIRTRSEGFLTTYLRDYQGMNVRAFYGVPQAGGWSTLYGPPMADVVGEEPIILDDDVIQVRQTPMHLVAEPAQLSMYADPVRPVFTMYKRDSLTDPWVAVPWAEIRDYNVRTGEIFLNTPLQIEDAALLRVDYTTLRRHYYFKRSGDTLLNLNPYSGASRQFIGKGIYVYIVPEYVKQDNGTLITASVTDEPLRFTTSPEIFDSLRPEYDPLAIMLGVIYISTALDITGLSIMDTRRRGGGIKDGANAQEVARLIRESATYWDIRHGSGSSYQKSGFVVVRLPAVLRDDFSEPEIVEAVERNITAGVKFKLEDLAGNDWSMV